jgi:phospholipase C
MGMEKIRHLVVLMLENRSFDNMVGYVYADKANHPPINIPPPAEGHRTTYDGLSKPAPDDDFWNPGNANFFEDPPTDPQKIPVTEQVTDFRMPIPDPGEEFVHITSQLFGPKVTIATQTDPHQMKGFALDYGSLKNCAGANIMQCYSAAQVPVITTLARSYAISDRWHASSPTQTWPNRAFVHLGTSRGKVNNAPNDPFHYDVPTIFNVLEELDFTPWGELVTWGVYNDTILPSLTRLQLPRLWDPVLDGHFHSFETFKQHARDGALPTYSFIEPSFTIDPNDEHPPHDVRLGEQFIHDVYQAVITGKDWEQTLLLITYDEHGGCYDHVPPPWNATPPDPESNPGEAGFCFNRFGVRVPALLISPYIEAGTVFRSTTSVPYDHTSILATILRDWLNTPSNKMLPSARIKAAPGFANVLSRTTPRTDRPVVTPQESLAAWRVMPDTAPNDLQKSIMIAMETKRLGRTLAVHEVQDLMAKIPTRRQMISYLKMKE